MEALDKAPKPVSRQSPRNEENCHASLNFNNSYFSNDDPLLAATGLTCHSTPSKKQYFKSERNVRPRNNSLPSNDRAKKRSSSYSYSYDRCNSLESDLELSCGNQSILQEKRLEFERRRRQVINYIW